MRGVSFRHSVCALVLLLCALPSQAGFMAFNFEYAFNNGETLTGMLEGDLQPDNETVLVSSITMISYSGAPDLTFGETLVQNVATVSGDSMFLIGGNSTDPGSSDGLWYLNGGTLDFPTPGTPGPAYVNGPAGVLPPYLVFEIFDHENWRLLEKSAVPAPGSLPLLGISLLALAGLKRLKNQDNVR